MGLQQFIVQQFIKHLGKTAKQHGGFQTAAYSQSLEPVYSMISDAAMAEGICEASSARWVAEHAKGSSFFQWIHDKNGKIKRTAIVDLAAQQRAGEAKKSQDRASEEFLFGEGLIRRTNPMMTRSGREMVPTRSFAEGVGNVGINLPKAMTASRLITGYYVMIGIYGSGGAHCMAAYIGQDICFFDPNFGEYWFPDQANFVKWFHESFWLSYRIGNLDHHFHLREYAPKMKFVTQYGRINRVAMGGH